MSDDHAASHDDHDIHPPIYYVKVWGVLCVLLFISFVGPWAGIQVITLATAFGIAFVKAWLVIKYFMHLDVEKRFVHYFLVTSVVFMGLMWAGLAPDIQNHEGTNWVNMAAKAEVERALAEQAAGGGGHGHDGGGHGADGHDDKPDGHGEKAGH